MTACTRESRFKGLDTSNRRINSFLKKYSGKVLDHRDQEAILPGVKQRDSSGTVKNMELDSGTIRFTSA